ncbi:phosphoenolpyruvate--protein phosphotransferase [Hoyosella subflava]|uniref:Phosphocarrier protein HPr n=1 Tax=Hoyosella subflava (strain DSM 45089 / JCM 17490 / NBRC 109087 / DQS3-9A1) TaxID=443218 RepID=F6EM33_HOYSD|nr:phosphoenolpyruvate--protein phosphotransferase [Hoyosella subflava]AEF42814.1 Multiphosphoryl transfer protein (MTP) [Hoyosella subflava DQS3-9A1]
MVGLVVVSHSRQLADAAVALASEMVHGRSLRIAVAAGLDERTLGTDAIEVQAAIEKVAGDEGVLVLMDLGSAVLSAELALDLLDPDIAANVRLCSAPIVEGLVAATVAAAGGASLAEVEAEAVGGLAGKQAHLGPAEPAPVAEVETNDGLTATFVVENAHGLHARPAARLAAEVRGRDARVHLRNVTTGSAPVPASSLTRLATLGALAGHKLEISATGRQAKETIDHVLSLAARHFDETVPTEKPPTITRQATQLGPRPASPGIGIGPAWFASSGEIDVSGIDSTAADPAAEWRRIRSATADTRHSISHTRATTARQVGETEAAVFDAHLMLLDDTELLDAVHAQIDAGASAPRAWADVLDGAAADFERLDDEYLRARAADVRAVRNQVLSALLGISGDFTPQDGVLIAADLTPAQAALLDRTIVNAIVLAHGSPTSHAAILARSLGIPAVVGAGPDVLAVVPGTMVAVDGDTGTLHVDPADSLLAGLRDRAARDQQQFTEALARAVDPAVTQDGVTVHVAANLGSLADAKAAVANGADLAGLIRTEFLFLGRDTAPTEAEQFQTYQRIAAALDGRRATFRTLDIGGDKPLPYVSQPHEENPFLGVRGLRLALAQPELFAPQLTALRRVAAQYPVSVMFPMVSTVDELAAAKHLLQEASAEPMRADTEVGMMIEVPSAALKAGSFAPHVDFFSIGTNDLTQYALAAERGNERLGALSDPLDPGVLRLIAEVCAAAHGQARVAVCGEIASDPVAAPLLLGLGVDELSVAPYSIPAVKQAVRGLSVEECRELAQQALRLARAEDVRALVPLPDPSAGVN